MFRFFRFQFMCNVCGKTLAQTALLNITLPTLYSALILGDPEAVSGAGEPGSSRMLRTATRQKEY